jgi:hypothetical protein
MCGLCGFRRRGVFPAIGFQQAAIAGHRGSQVPSTLRQTVFVGSIPAFVAKQASRQSSTRTGFHHRARQHGEKATPRTEKEITDRLPEREATRREGNKDRCAMEVTVQTEGGKASRGGTTDRSREHELRARRPTVLQRLWMTRDGGLVLWSGDEVREACWTGAGQVTEGRYWLLLRYHAASTRECAPKSALIQRARRSQRHRCKSAAPAVAAPTLLLRQTLRSDQCEVELCCRNSTALKSVALDSAGTAGRPRCVQKASAGRTEPSNSHSQQQQQQQRQQRRHLPGRPASGPPPASTASQERAPEEKTVREKDDSQVACCSASTGWVAEQRRRWHAQQGDKV